MLKHPMLPAEQIGDQVLELGVILDFALRLTEYKSKQAELLADAAGIGLRCSP